MENKHTHEVRLWDYRRPKGQDIEVLHKGDNDSCFAHLQKIADEMNADGKHRFGVGYLTSNGGYSVVVLQEERDLKIKRAAPELLNAVTKAIFDLETLQMIFTGETSAKEDVQNTIDICKSAIKKAVE